ncbi:hypothetical protein T02_11768 [Trichinella nativa]|uniref:Uncharacterized protein n=2 Tax=Trichinella TaxID=6333 RepID=A0A0V1KXX3_9BILA|nr:hypothetical protein T05_11625 [Trichinella murrelli]KRZ51829.1 hypothetical protein T02_11768 [Trichinella nativa]
MLMALAFLPVNLREWLPTTKIPLWNIHGVALRTNNHLEGWHSRKNYGARE